MYAIFSILILIVSVFLVLIVLVQNSKGGGLASGFASSNQVLGVRKTTDFLEKMTWGLACALFFLCIAITGTIPRGQTETGSEVLDYISAPMDPATPDFGTPMPNGAQQGIQFEPLDVPAD